MLPCKGVANGKKLLLVGEKAEQNQNLDALIKANFEQFLRYIATIGFHVENSFEATSYQDTSITHINFPTTCFKVDFNDNFVTITAIKKEE